MLFSESVEQADIAQDKTKHSNSPEPRSNLCRNINGFAQILASCSTYE